MKLTNILDLHELLQRVGYHMISLKKCLVRFIYWFWFNIDFFFKIPFKILLTVLILAFNANRKQFFLFKDNGFIDLMIQWSFFNSGADCFSRMGRCKDWKITIISIKQVRRENHKVLLNFLVGDCINCEPDKIQCVQIVYKGQKCHSLFFNYTHGLYYVLGLFGSLTSMPDTCDN